VVTKVHIKAEVRIRDQIKVVFVLKACHWVSSWNLQAQWDNQFITCNKCKVLKWWWAVDSLSNNNNSHSNPVPFKKLTYTRPYQSSRVSPQKTHTTSNKLVPQSTTS
jgi:hypothetical protein